jgi:hypothetical protein
LLASSGWAELTASRGGPCQLPSDPQGHGSMAWASRSTGTPQPTQVADGRATLVGEEVCEGAVHNGVDEAGGSVANGTCARVGCRVGFRAVPGTHSTPCHGGAGQTPSSSRSPMVHGQEPRHTQAWCCSPGSPSLLRTKRLPVTLVMVPSFQMARAVEMMSVKEVSRMLPMVAPAAFTMMPCTCHMALHLYTARRGLRNAFVRPLVATIHMSL